MCGIRVQPNQHLFKHSATSRSEERHFDLRSVVASDIVINTVETGYIVACHTFPANHGDAYALMYLHLCVVVAPKRSGGARVIERCVDEKQLKPQNLCRCSESGSTILVSLPCTMAQNAVRASRAPDPAFGKPPEGGASATPEPKRIAIITTQNSNIPSKECM